MTSLWNCPAAAAIPAISTPSASQLNEEGQVCDSIVGGPAYKAGITSGMKVIGVDGRVFTHDLLEDAIKGSKDSSHPSSSPT